MPTKKKKIAKKKKNVGRVFLPLLPFNNLTPAEDERLSLLAEECAEVIQIVMKIQRHGFESYHPADSLRRTNRSLLEHEIGHVKCAITLMYESEDLDRYAAERSFSEKKRQVNQYLHHNRFPDCGE